MNDLINIVRNRKSVRNFTGEEVKKEDLKLILETMLRIPGTRNLQFLSYVVVDDKEKIEKLAINAGNQKQVASADKVIVIIGDMNKLLKASEKAGNKIENKIFSTSLVADMFGDAGIAAATIDLLSNSLGYGSTIIGGISVVDPLETAKLLNLPENSFPLLGVTIGVPEGFVRKAPLKPRIDFENVVFFNEYDEEKAIDGVIKYNEELNLWWNSINLKMPSHLEVVKSYLETINSERLKELILSKGF